ncbi:MAG TPA: hypothetical protein VMD07_02360 [Candidatus Acidoferrales bacterium]|nr:hypothetical protein [Candidatus Acidoferrales bacterium]
MRRLPVSAITTLLFAALLAGRAAAAPMSADVPKIEGEAPSLDPSEASTWAHIPELSLRWDVVHARPAADATTVRVATDGKFLYVRFDAKQNGPIVISQHSDDVITGGSSGTNGTLSWSNDDAVWVDLWPTGPAGFQYQFESNPGGSHNEASSENTAFAPHWESRGAVHDGGYTVTMAIPLKVIHGLHVGAWRAQFVRYVRSTGAEYVWSYDSLQTNADDSSRSGTIVIPVVTVAAARPQPRFAPYALAAAAAPSAGGSTSRVGADASFPISPTAAFFATWHPDYSNVELDQQTISPSVYQRVYNEVRPFFTQAAQYYGQFNCNVCGGYRTLLYTPAIPTPAQGYAFEGKQGDFGLAAFDAIGANRTDAATALDYTSQDTRWQGSFEHVTADVPGIIDDSNEIGINYQSLKYLSAYANYSTDTGTNVLSPSRATAVEAGGGWINQDFALFGAVRNIGEEFNPVDGFNFHPGIAGWAIYSAKEWVFAPNDALQSMGIMGVIDRYMGPQYGLAQSDNQLEFDLLTKSAWDFQIYSGSDYWRFGELLTPISTGSGFQVTYHSGLQNNMGNFPTHGASATPTVLAYVTGHYGLGRLDTWTRNSTIRAGDKGSVTLTVDNTAQWQPRGIRDNVQWFDSLAYSYQVNANSSFAIGLRDVIGNPPQPNGGGDCLDRCANISIAYHLRLKNEEFYLAYGDPNTLVTVPQAIFKVIFYAGGQKGT